MRICESPLWAASVREVVDTLPMLHELEGKSVLVTGCTGLICSAVVDLLCAWNSEHDPKIRVIAAARGEQRVNERFGSWAREGWFAFVPYDATRAHNDFSFACDYLIHGASNASPNMIVQEPVETMLSNFVGMNSLLEYARDRRVSRTLFVSSSEVYGLKSEPGPSKVGDYGYIDLLNPRNSYSVGKRAAETLCASYANEYGVDTVIVRPGHIYGPSASEADVRVSSAWSYEVARGNGIVMKSDGSQVRSYCHCLDCASAILTVLLRGASGCAYNISNPESILSIRQMAELLTKAAGVSLSMQAPTEEERRAFNPMSDSSLDSTELLALGWKGLFDAERGFGNTVRVLREVIGE